VQDLLKRNADMVVKDLLEDLGHIYVCGDISMAASVRKTVQVWSGSVQALACSKYIAKLHNSNVTLTYCRIYLRKRQL